MAAPRRWIRLDAEWEESGWLDSLSGEAAGCWPRLLCWVKLRGSHGRSRRPAVTTLARRWRVSPKAVEELEAAATLDGALRIEDGDWVLPNWPKYQDIDSTAAERKRRQRDRQMSRDVTDVTRDTGVTRHATPDIDRTDEQMSEDKSSDRGGSVQANGVKKGRPTWLTPFWEPWVRRCGGEPNAGQLAKVVTRLKKQYAVDDLVRAWTYFLEHTDPQFCSPSSFSQRAGHWLKQSTPRWSGYS